MQAGMGGRMRGRVCVGVCDHPTPPVLDSGDGATPLPLETCRPLL